MDIAYNKVDQTVLPISQDRVSASEYNQIAASLMQIITSAGLTPDSQDNAQLLNALGPRIVETYSNGTSWYRVYSDGWCEQGGYSSTASTTISLLKAFTNTNYTIVTAMVSTTTGGAYTNCIQKNTTSFIADGTQPFDWQACGYIS